jgi:dihydroorotase
VRARRHLYGARGDRALRGGLRAAGVLDKLEAFASFNGADFYRLPRNTGSIILRKETWTVPGEIPFGAATLVPLRAGETVAWRLA